MQPHWTLLVSLTILAIPTAAQPEALRAPASGLVFIPGSSALRPLLGVPGGAHLGAPVLVGVTDASPAPDGRCAFVTTAAGSFFLRGLDATPVGSTAPGMIASVDRVVWSRDASHAALYSSASGSLQHARLKDCRASVDDPVGLSSWGVPSTIAIDPAGRIAFGIPGAGLYLIEDSRPAVLLASISQPAAAAFSDSGTLYAVDAATRRILEFHDDLSPADFAVVEDATDAAFEPVALAVSGTGKHLLAADKATRSLRVYDVATRMPGAAIPLDLAPVRLERLSERALFVVNRPRGKEWLLVLDATDTPRVYFVPAPGEEAQ